MPLHLRRTQDLGERHFLTFSCFDRRPKLNNSDAYATFEQVLESLRRRNNFFVYGYVLMPEHVHLLVTEPRAASLATILNVLKTQTARRLKNEEEPFWERRYYDFNLFTDGKHVEKLRYMHRNPVVRGLVQHPEDWPWSSFDHYLTGRAGRVEIESSWTMDARIRQGEGSSDGRGWA